MPYQIHYSGLMCDQNSSLPILPDIFDSLVSQGPDSIEELGMIPSPLHQDLTQRMSMLEISWRKYADQILSSPFQVKPKDQHQEKMADPLAEKESLPLSSSQGRKEQLIQDRYSRFKSPVKEIQDEFIFDPFDSISDGISKGRVFWFEGKRNDLSKSQEEGEKEMIDERNERENEGQRLNETEMNYMESGSRSPQSNSFMGFHQKKVKKPAKDNGENQQKRQAEKLFGDYLSQVLRITMKKLKIEIQKNNLFSRNQQKSKKYVLFLLSQLHNKNLLSETFSQKLSQNLSERLQKIRKKISHGQVFIKQIEIQFYYFKEAVKEFADGDINKSIQVLFARNENPRRLHQKTYLAIEEAKQSFGRKA